MMKDKFVDRKRLKYQGNPLRDGYGKIRSTKEVEIAEREAKEAKDEEEGDW